MRERTIHIDGDRSVPVLEAGDGGRPLLLAHGLTGAKEDFADHLDALAAAGWWAVAPDQRGHGGSFKPEDEADYSLAHYADDLWALSDTLGWSRLVLLGHSMGGMAVQAAALARPDALDGLVLMDTTYGPIPTIDPDLATIGQSLVRDGGMPAVKAALDGMGEDAPLGTPAHERLLRERPGYPEFCDRKFLACSPAMYAAMLVALLDQEDRLDDLASLDVATLVIVGDQDEPFLKPSLRMAETMSRTTHVVVPDAGHSPQFENAPVWRQAVLDFLGTL